MRVGEGERETPGFREGDHPTARKLAPALVRPPQQGPLDTGNGNQEALPDCGRGDKKRGRREARQAGLPMPTSGHKAGVGALA